MNENELLEAIANHLGIAPDVKSIDATTTQLTIRSPSGVGLIVLTLQESATGWGFSKIKLHESVIAIEELEMARLDYKPGRPHKPIAFTEPSDDLDDFL